MSFGVIFSIILIVFILVTGIIVVKYFLDFQKCGQVKIFVDDFNEGVDRVWKSDSLEFNFEGRLPSGLEYVCFFNSSRSVRGNWDDVGNEINVFDRENLFFYPLEKSCDNPAHRVQHLNLGSITRTDNPYCIPVRSGRVVIGIEKGMNEGLVGVR